MPVDGSSIGKDAVGNNAIDKDEFENGAIDKDAIESGAVDYDAVESVPSASCQLHTYVNCTMSINCITFTFISVYPKSFLIFKPL